MGNGDSFVVAVYNGNLRKGGGGRGDGVGYPYISTIYKLRYNSKLYRHQQLVSVYRGMNNSLMYLGNSTRFANRCTI